MSEFSHWNSLLGDELLTSKTYNVATAISQSSSSLSSATASTAAAAAAVAPSLSSTTSLLHGKKVIGLYFSAHW